MTPPDGMSELDFLLSVQRLLDTTSRWRIVMRWHLRRYRDASLRRLVVNPPEERPTGEAPLLRGL
jgi:hypothetical protein